MTDIVKKALASVRVGKTKQQINIRLKAGSIAKLRGLADKNGVSLNQLVNAIIEAAVDEYAADRAVGGVVGVRGRPRDAP